MFKESTHRDWRSQQRSSRLCEGGRHYLVLKAIEGNCHGPPSAKNTPSNCSRGISTCVSKKLEIISLKRVTGIMAWLKGISGQLTGL